jgi:hypothetical protein
MTIQKLAVLLKSSALAPWPDIGIGSFPEAPIASP